MAIEYRQVLARFIPRAETPGAGIGEFYALPVFTCAGLMFMASAIDFLLIFVSLELVTISFYVLVAYMRRQSASLEAGVKYLILSALSTGFLVYGITWIFGVTGETNLLRIGTQLKLLLAGANQVAGVAPGALYGSSVPSCLPCSWSLWRSALRSPRRRFNFGCRMFIKVRRHRSPRS